jgi:thiosulfate dehydrogenase (quinone) large subunit
MAAPPPPPPIPAQPAATALNLTAAFIILRLFMGFRLALSGLEKMEYFVAKTSTILDGKAPTTPGEALKLRRWLGESGVTSELPYGDGKMANIASVMTEHTMLPKWMIQGFLIPLPYAMLVTGLLILIGLFNRLAWWLAGMIWFSLALGQMLLPDEGTVQQLGVYLLMCAVALILVDHNRIRITRM